MVGDFWLAGEPFFLLGGLANSDFFALERKARLASERSAEACAGLERKSKKIGRRKGGRFHATFSISATAECIDKSAAPARSSAVASAPTAPCAPEPAGSPPGPSATPLPSTAPPDRFCHSIGRPCPPPTAHCASRSRYCSCSKMSRSTSLAHSSGETPGSRPCELPSSPLRQDSCF